MTRVRIRSSDDIEHHDIAVVDIDVIPRVGERIEFTPHDDDSLGYSVLFVHHNFIMTKDRLIEHEVLLTIELMSSPPHTVWIEWQDQSERPPWIPEETQIECDSVPVRGDILQLGVNREDQDPNEHAYVEVVAVAHNTLLYPDLAAEDIGLFGQTQTGLVVRAAGPGIAGDIQRVIARRN
jgi:hypothetical protein